MLDEPLCFVLILPLGIICLLITKILFIPGSYGIFEMIEKVVISMRSEQHFLVIYSKHILGLTQEWFREL